MPTVPLRQDPSEHRVRGATIDRYPTSLAAASLCAVLSGLGAAEPQTGGGWGKAVGGLQARLVLDRTSFTRGEAVRAKVLVKNVSGKPIRYDGRSGQVILVYLDEGEEKAVPKIDPSYQVDADLCYSTGEPSPVKIYRYPELKPGEVATASSHLVGDSGELLVAGKYRAKWSGTHDVRAAVEPRENARHMRIEHLVFTAEEGELRAKTKRVAVGVPPAEAELEVADPPGASPGVVALARLQRALPLGWKIEGICFPSEGIPTTSSGSIIIYSPTAAAKSALAVRLLHQPAPGRLTRNMACLWVEAGTERLPTKAGDGPKATFLGRGPLGGVYLHGDARGRWNWSAHDVASALAVTAPKPEAPGGPDWGRLMSRILWRYYKTSLSGSPWVDPFNRLAKVRPEPGQLARLSYRSNAQDDPSSKTGLARRDPGSSYYLVDFSVTPTPQQETQQPPELSVDAHFRGPGTWRYTALGVDLELVLRSDDGAFIKTLQGVLVKEVNAVVAKH